MTFNQFNHIHILPLSHIFICNAKVVLIGIQKSAFFCFNLDQKFKRKLKKKHE